MNVAFVGFTFIDEPDPPLTYQLILYHIFIMLKTNITLIHPPAPLQTPSLALNPSIRASPVQKWEGMVKKIPDLLLYSAGNYFIIQISYILNSHSCIFIP